MLSDVAGSLPNALGDLHGKHAPGGLFQSVLRAQSAGVVPSREPTPFSGNRRAWPTLKISTMSEQANETFSRECDRDLD
jgi:hypothetical protein